MARYRKLSICMLTDEKVRSLSPTEKLVWFGLFLSEQLTPMGAGALHPIVLAESLGLSVEQLESALSTITARGMILRDGHLVIIKNFLLPDYNGPESPHNLKAWVSACETLKRSAQWEVLKNHLWERLNGKPDWLFRALLNPLAEGKQQGLARLFWVHTGLTKPTGKGRGSRPQEQEKGAGTER